METGKIHIWSASLELPEHEIDALNTSLSAAERSRAERFRFPHHRRRFIAARGILRALLSRYLESSPADIQIHVAADGKPFIPVHSRPLYFNLSHSGDRAVYGFSLHSEIGVDIEQLRPCDHFEQISHTFFRPEEMAYIANAVSDEERISNFFRLWTRKEACIKYSGRGLRIGLKSFDVCKAGVAPASIRVDGDDLTLVDLFAQENSLFGAIAYDAEHINGLAHHEWQGRVQ